MVCVKGAISLFLCVAEALKPEEPEEKEFHRVWLQRDSKAETLISSFMDVSG